MSIKQPFKDIFLVALDENNRPSGQEDADHRAQDNPFKLNLLSACITENIKAVVAMVKQAVKQPFQLLADVFFPTIAILETLRQPALLKATGSNLARMARQTSHGLPSPYYG